MANIPIRDMTQTGTPSGTDLIVFDNGTMRKGTVASMADAVRPVASQSEAQVGSDNAKTMTPLRVKESIAAQVGVTVQAYDEDLAAVASLSGTGIVRRTGANTFTTGTVVTPAEGGTGVNNGASTITLGGALTVSGAFTTTFNVSAATNLTLPAGTHTLAALDVIQSWTALQGYASGNLALNGATSGRLVLDVAALAGTNTLKFPAGSTDFTTTGGTSQVVRQSSTGAPFTVGQLVPSDIGSLGTGVATWLATPSSANLRAALTDETGTGAAVFGTSPNITTPTGIVKGDVGLGNVDNTSDANKPVSTAQAAAIALKANIASPTFTGTPAAPTATVGTNTTQIASTAFVQAAVTASTTGVSSIAGNTGAFTLSTGIANSGNDIRLNVGQLPGETSTGSASAGNIGEYVFSSIPIGSAVSLTSAVAANVTSISLTAGDWDVVGLGIFGPGGSTVSTLYIVWISTTSATLPTAPNNGSYSVQYVPNTAGASAGLPTGPVRISVASTTTVYLSVYSSFSVSTNAGYGFLRARRVR